MRLQRHGEILVDERDVVRRTVTDGVSAVLEHVVDVRDEVARGSIGIQAVGARRDDAVRAVVRRTARSGVEVVTIRKIVLRIAEIANARLLESDAVTERAARGERVMHLCREKRIALGFVVVGGCRLSARHVVGNLKRLIRVDERDVRVVLAERNRVAQERVGLRAVVVDRGEVGRVEDAIAL